MLDDNKPVDLALQKGVQERRIIKERHAAIRLTTWTEHGSLRQNPVPADRLSIVDGDKTNGANAVKGCSLNAEISIEISDA